MRIDPFEICVMGRHDQSAPSLTWTLPDGTRGINRACPHPGLCAVAKPVQHQLHA
jgi:hypothetical protein